MDADGTGTSKRGRRPKKPKKLKFKPKVPPQKPKKQTPEKQKQEEPKPIDEELMKTLRTIRGAAKYSPHIKDKQSQNSHSTLSSEAGPGLPFPQSGRHKHDQPKKELQIPRLYSFAANREMFYDDEEDEDQDDYEEEDDSIEFQGNQPSSTECEYLTQPAKELNLIEQDDKTRMFLFQLPRSLPLPKVSSTAPERNGKAIGKGVKEGYNMNELPGGYLGKMLIYKSGKIKMKLGDAMFNVNPGVECGMAQHAVAMNTREKHCCLLGEIENKHVVVTPNVDSLLKDNRG